MAFGIKTINSIKNCLPINTRLLLMKAIIVSHIHYPAVLLSGISSSLLISLEKQLSWAVKICFNRRKYDRSSDLKFDHGILPVKFLLDQIAICFLWRILHNQKPAYFSIPYPTNSFCINRRNSLAHFNLFQRSRFLHKGFFKTSSELLRKFHTFFPWYV